ncbi:MAG: chorismate synthase [Proteobacteria bacterium]|nr:MAG: chorismate synthase [Pseudomonadota bacterium]
MSGNTFGHLFRVTTFGESHGGGLGAVVDGCPPRLSLSAADIQPDLDRRRPGASRLGTARREADAVRLVSGVAAGLTTGTPIALLFDNNDARPKAYSEMARLYRPSHADFTYQAKYGHRARSGGGRASARETVARVAAGAIARKLLAEQLGVEIVAWVDEVADVGARVDPDAVTRAAVAAHPDVQCPDDDAAPKMIAAIEAARKDGDTLGGVIRCVARGVPAGFGDPVFDKLDARLAYAMLGLPAAKGFDLGSGFAGTRLRGSAHNDPFAPGDGGGVVTTSNRSGGVQGGISNGMPVDLRVAFKPVATHFKPQQTVTEQGEATTFRAKGRHDPCVLPRAVVIVEAMTALVLADAWLRQRGQAGE